MQMKNKGKYCYTQHLYIFLTAYLESYLCVELIEEYRAEAALGVLSENLVFSSLKFSKQTVQIEIFSLSVCLSLSCWECFPFYVSHCFLLEPHNHRITES